MRTLIDTSHFEKLVLFFFYFIVNFIDLKAALGFNILNRLFHGFVNFGHVSVTENPSTPLERAPLVKLPSLRLLRLKRAKM